MTMKSMNVKVPLSVAKKMDDNGEFNPAFFTSFIEENVTHEVPDEPIKELTVNYTFKIDSDLHTQTKLIAIQRGLAMNEMIGRLLSRYY